MRFSSLPRRSRSARRTGGRRDPGVQPARCHWHRLPRAVDVGDVDRARIVAIRSRGVGDVLAIGRQRCRTDDLWDKLGSTYVAWSPQGYRPLTAQEYVLGGQPLPQLPV
jgi:hypothetical protein